ncbi:MAG: MT-A70 family methyltransferase [Elusimicrobiota bacterium]
MFKNIENLKFKTVVCDPPWQFRRQPKSVGPTYNLLTLDEIKLFPIRDISDENAHLYLWIPNAFIKEGVSVMEAWGFSYKTVITWVKHQVGVGNHFRNSSEQILFGVRGRLPLLRRDLRTWFLADRRQHSRKPDEFYRIVESASPGPRIDVFSREMRHGWAQWGDECNFFNQKITEENYASNNVGAKPTING